MSDRSKLEALVKDLVERHRATQQGDPSLRDTSGVRRGDIFVARPDPDDPEAMRRYVLVVRVVPSRNYVSVLLLDNLPSFADDHDLILRPAESGLAFESVVHANVRAPLWITQLGEHRGTVTGEILDMLPDVAEGAVPAKHAYRTGLPLQSREDPRREHKRRELAELHRLAAGCTKALLESGDFWGYSRSSAEGTEILERLVARGKRRIITFPHVFTPGNEPPRTNHPELVGTLDPGVFHTVPDHKTPQRFLRELAMFLKEQPGVETPTPTPELVDDYVEMVRATFGPNEARNFLKAHPPRPQQEWEIPTDKLEYVMAAT